MTREPLALRGGQLLILVALLVGSQVGCAGRYMTPASPTQAIVADASAATVIFVRPSNYGGAASFVVVEGDGRYLGETRGREYFVDKFPPGERTFVSWGENADMVKANLEAGKIYYVLLSVRMGIWSARMSLSALTPDRSEWPKLPAWMAASREMSRDEEKIAKWLTRHEDDVQARIRSAHGAWDRYNQAKRDVRTLEPGDGFATPPH